MKENTIKTLVLVLTAVALVASVIASEITHRNLERISELHKARQNFHGK